MDIFNELSGIQNIRPTSVALGFFDGLHIGHRKLLDMCLEDAAKRGTRSAIFTFREHPKNIMHKKTVVPRLLAPKDKHALLEDFGFDYLFEIPFEKEFKALSPKIFARDILKNKLLAQAVFCGFNFRFGKAAEGSSEALIDFGEKFDFEVFVLDPVRAGSSESGAAAPVVSSTRIRELIKKGDMDTANALLGRAYSLSGIVAPGKKLGRVLGFPTANFAIPPEMTRPSTGSYISRAYIEGVSVPLPAVTNIGVNPTTDSKQKRIPILSIETHILEKTCPAAAVSAYLRAIFAGKEELYGKKIKVELLRALRPEKKFETLEALKIAIANDVAIASGYFN